MAQFRERPYTVEARQWWRHGDHPLVKQGGPGISPTHGYAKMPIGRVVVAPGHWIVTDLDESQIVAVLSPERFAERYEPVDGPDAPHAAPRPAQSHGEPRR